MANEVSLAPTATTPEVPPPARVVTGPIEGAVRRVVEPPPEPEVKAPKGPTVEGPEGTSGSYTPDEGHPIEAPAVEEGKVVALGGAVEGRAGILDSAQADAEALRQQAAEEQRAQDEMAATQFVQRKASSLPAGPAGGGPAPAAPAAGLEATAGDEAAIRAQTGAEFSGFSAGAREWSPRGGGGGGSPVVAKPPPPVPNVAGREPASALAALGALPPAQILGAMGGGAAAATKAVGKKEKALASAPPTKRIAAGPAGPGAPAAKPTINTKVEEVKPSGGKAPEVKAGAEKVEAPPIVLSGETDPANVAAQAAAGKAAAAAATNAAKAGLAIPRGEERLHPKVKAQTVKPPVTVGGGGVEVTSEGVGQAEASIVAFQEKPGELHSAVAKGSGQLSKAAAEASKKEAKEHKESDREIKKAEADHAKEMKEEQAKGRKEVAKERKKADSQHAKLVSSHSKEATAKKAEAITKVKTEKAKGDTDAKREVREANNKIASEKRKGEEKARKAEEEEKKKDSGGGVWGAIKRGASAVASAVKSAVKAVVEAVKSAVKSIVSAVVSAVGSVLKGVWNAIKSVVKAALDVIKKLASAFLDALKALIDAALALIDSLIKAALAALQALANLLPGVLGKLLGALVSALKAVYDALKAAYKAAIEAVKSAVKAVVSWAKSAIAAFGMLAALVKDIAASPGRWFSNLIASAKDGIMNHLWGALKGAVKAWWDGKVKNLIGAPKEVLALLVKGGITFAMVLTMAWEAIKAALPELIIQQLIEKVVSALNVGAGTALLLLRALQAAWASIGAIVGAIQKFFGFLKAVKGGGAGPQFAVAVAAGAVAVIEFVSNFLMARLGSKLKPFKDKLSGLAKKIGEKLLGATKKAGSKIVKAGKVVLHNVRSSKLGKIAERGVGKAGDLKKKYDAWKYGTKDGTSKWANAEAAEDAGWSSKVHQKTGGRFGTAPTTTSTPHRTTGGDQSEAGATTSTATAPNQLETRTRVGEVEHELKVRRGPDGPEVWVCSNVCGPIKGKIDGMLRDVHDPNVRRQLEALQLEADALEVRIRNGGLPENADRLAALHDLGDRLRVIGDADPGVGKLLDTEPDFERLGITVGAPNVISPRDVGSLPLPDNTRVLYVVRDRNTGELLKVGETTTGSQLKARFDRYSLAGRRLDTELEIEVRPVVVPKGQGVRTYEQQLREQVDWGESGRLPWDNTVVEGLGPRLGRPGPGTPFEPLPGGSRLRKEGWTYNEHGQLVPPDGGPPVTFRRKNAPPPVEDLRRLMADAAGEVEEIAQAAGVSRRTIYAWLDRYGLKARDFR